MPKKKSFTVEVWDHDDWSGCSLSHTRGFDRLCDASRYINSINGLNTAAQVPSFYQTANLKGVNRPLMFR